MKRIAVAIALIAVAACTAQEEAPVMDTTAAPAAAPAPEAVMDSAAVDSTVVDSMVVPPPTE